MAELRKDFSKARMNKDMDERLVPPGEYRDANNIQISTSDGSDIGTVQSLFSNKSRGNTFAEITNGDYNRLYTDTTVESDVKHSIVGSIADASKDKIYYLVSGGDQYDSSSYNSIRKDYIIQYDTIRETNTYVFVDIFGVDTTVSGTPESTTTFHIALGAGSSEYNIGVRVGMNITTTATTPNTTVGNNILVTNVAYDSGEGKWEITTNKAHGLSSSNSITFESERVLNFSKFNLITGINILDDFIYWTDNVTEPKKINISRSIAGTGGLVELNTEVADTFIGNTDNFHTRLVRDTGSYSDSQSILNVVVNDAGTRPVYVDESHVTVIRKAPTQPLKLDMFRLDFSRINSSGEENPTTALDEFVQLDFSGQAGGQAVGVSGTVFTQAENISFTSPVDFRVNDIIQMTLEENFDVETAERDYFDFRFLVVDSPVTGPNNLSTGPFTCQLVSSSPDGDQYMIGNQILQSGRAKLERKNIIFDHKFPRFSYRYKYQDGEYSTFAPFSEVAFLTGDYDYKSNKGYNFGMSNQLRALTLSGFIGDEKIMPEDVVEIDILYKETNNPTVYTVKTIKPTDTESWPTADQIVNDNHRGKVNITTDLIHSVVPSNQLLRPYDNVPRQAKAQEVTANRIIYGNYLQNYTIENNPKIFVGYEQDKYTDLGYDYAPPSVKSIRKYQIGVVFSDKYGRETPVLSSDSSSISIPIQASSTRNRITASFDPKDTVLPDWAEYFSFYIKEPSAEYYTMAMDRWYNAEDGNIWISFPSADRNKIQEDDTIILKKASGSNTAIKVDNRYKVLAISSEAPDFIKETRKNLGAVIANLTTAGEPGIGTAAGNQWPVPGERRIRVARSLFRGAFGENLHVLTPDKLLIRFYGVGESSERYEVAKITQAGPVTGDDPNGSGDFIITIKRPLGEDVAFTSTTSSGADAIDNLRLELTQVDVENRPEFDGRFFVKIFKDQTLAENVLIQTEQEYSVGPTFPLRYLNNNGYKYLGANNEILPAILTPFSSNNSVNYAQDFNGDEIIGSQPLASVGSTYQDRSKHPTEYTYNTGGLLDDDDGNETSASGTYYWGGSSTATGSDSPFDSGLTASHIDENPLWLNTMDEPGDSDVYFESLANTESFWIDAATAYSWNGINEGQSLQGNITFGGDESLASDYPEGAGLDGGITGNQQQILNNGYINYNSYGQPSRGIWGNGRLMDISWCRFGPNNSNNSAPFAQNLQGAGTSQADPYEFITQFVQEGTKFRFTRDPDAIVYTVVGTYGYGTGPISSNLSYNNNYLWYPPLTSNEYGAWGIRNYQTKGLSQQGRAKKQYNYGNIRQRWTVRVQNEAGGGIGSAGYGYHPARGTKPLSEGGPATTDAAFRRALHHDGTNADAIQIMLPLDLFLDSEDTFVDNPAIWEIEPRESVELDIYYQASPKIPVVLDDSTNEELLPIGSTFIIPAQEGSQGALETPETLHTITGWDGQTMTFTPAITGGYVLGENQVLRFSKYSNYSLEARVNTSGGTLPSNTTSLTLHGGPDTTDNLLKISHQKHILDWNNCWCFGNGVESDRIRDMFNDPQMDNGVKASTVLSDPSLLKEERRKHGLIWSGVYNNVSGSNDTNQFIQAEPITKDINPVYGSIQRLLNRETRLVMFCEDKVLRAVTNKDALYNADGNPQLVASNAVIGDVTPYAGRYGIGKNPESLAVTPSSSYFTDVIRGKVLALSNSGDGVREISAIGMKDYFADYMAEYVDTAIGSYDSRKKEYNITINKKYENYQAKPHEQITVSYSEYSKGWISFKSYYPDTGLSLNNKYYTFKNGLIWEHHYEQDAGTSASHNNFYGTQYKSDVTAVFNEMSESVKGFSTIKYEGTKAAVPVFQSLNNQNYFNGDYSTNNGLVDTDNVNDGEYYNIFLKNESALGWYVDNLETNLQTCGKLYFKNKEGKYYAYPTGETTALTNLDTREFSVQGIGQASIVHGDNTVGNQATLTFENNIVGSRNFGAGGTSDSSNQAISLGVNRWSVTSATYNATVGTAIGSSQTVEMTISPFYEGVYTGLPVSASNFELDGATESPSGTFTVDSNTSVISNPAGSSGDGQELDSAVQKVVFTDNGIADDPENTVKVTVHLNPTFTPTADTVTSLDIDETEQLVARQRSSCLQVLYDNLDNATETINAVTGISTSNVVNTNYVITEHDGTVNEGEANLIAHYSFAATGDSFYNGGSQYPSVTFSNVGEYAPYYSYTTTPTFTNGNLVSFVVKIYYTPPTSPPYLSVDPPNMCTLGHMARIGASIFTPDSGLSDVRSVSYESNVGAEGGVKTITVRGSKGSKYKLLVEKKQGLTNPITATTGGYYNFVTNVFVDDEAGAIGTIPSSGFVDHLVSFPRVTSDTRYDITIDGNVGSESYTVDDRVPTIAGDASITQYGVRTLTIQPVTQTASDFGVLPSLDVIRPARYDNDSFLAPPVQKIKAVGTTNNVSSTRLILDKANERITENMFVIDKSSNTSIPHGTTVSSIVGDLIILSAACTIPNNTDLTFVTNNSSIVSFSLTVPAGTGKTLTINTSTDVASTVPTSSVSFIPDVAQSDDTVIKPSTTTYTSVEQFELVSRVNIGDIVTGDQVTVANLKVQATDTTALTVTLDQSDLGAENSKRLSFSGATLDNASIIHATTALSSGNLVVSGYIHLVDINESVNLPIFIDNLVNVN